MLLKQDDLNLKRIYEEHVHNDMTFTDFKKLCSKCWNSDTHGFVVVNKDCELNRGRYRCGMDVFVTGL